MARPNIVTLVSREAQTSNTAVYKKDLPKAGGISAIDLGIRLTNGSTGIANLDLLDVLKKIELVFNGTDRRLSMTGQEMYRLHWLKYGAPPIHTWTHVGSGVQEVKFRYMPGRYLGDPEYGIDLSRFNNVQLSVDYDATVWGAAGVTTFTTGTFSPTVMLHMFPPGQVPGFRGMIGAREIWNYTTVGGSVNKDVDLPASNPISGIGLFAMEDNIAEATDVTDIIIGKDQFSTRWVDGKWYDLQPICNAALKVREETYRLYATDADSLDCHLANIKKVDIQGNVISWVTGTTNGVIDYVAANGATGNRATIVGNTITTGSGAATLATSALAAKAAWAKISGDVHGALYFPFGDQNTFADPLQPADLASAQVRILDAAAGAYAAVVVEEIYR